MNKFHIFILRLALLITLSLCNTACSVLFPISVVTTLLVATDVRTVGTQIDDKVIASKARFELGKADMQKLFANIAITVQEGRVLMIGSVTEISQLEQAEGVIWKIPGVKEVINEVQIANSDEKINKAEDIWLANQIRAKFVMEKAFSSGNFDVDVHNKMVYLLGITDNKKELQKAIKIASSVNGVVKVVNHAILKDDPRRIK